MLHHLFTIRPCMPLIGGAALLLCLVPSADGAEQQAAPRAEQDQEEIINSEELNGSLVKELLPPTAAQYLTLSLDIITAYDKLGRELAQVKDKTSAEIAVPSIEPIVQEICELTEQQLALHPPTPDVEEYVRTKLKNAGIEDIVEKSLGKVIDLLTLSDPPCHGSQKLAEHLTELVQALIGRQE